MSLDASLISPKAQQVLLVVVVQWFVVFFNMLLFFPFILSVQY